VGNLAEVEQQLIMAAAVQGFLPSTYLGRANTVRIVNQVLRWRGLTIEQVEDGWREEDCDPEHGAVYETLVRMTQQVLHDSSVRPAERPGTPVFEGSGNWGVPGDPLQLGCWPHYNSCRLTAEGERIARELLRRNPEYLIGAVNEK
jgi:hypothetical protein